MPFMLLVRHYGDGGGQFIVAIWALQADMSNLCSHQHLAAVWRTSQNA